MKSIGTLVRDISGVDIPCDLGPIGKRMRNSSQSPDAKSKGNSPVKLPQGLKNIKAENSDGRRAKAYTEAKKNAPILGIHSLKTAFEENKNKFCTTVGQDSVRDMEQHFICERKFKEIRA